MNGGGTIDKIIAKIETEYGKTSVIGGGSGAYRDISELSQDIRDAALSFRKAVSYLPPLNFFFVKTEINPMPFRLSERRYFHTFTKPADKGRAYGKAQASKWANTYSTKVG